MFFCIRKSWNLRNFPARISYVCECGRMCVSLKVTYIISIQFGNADRKIKLYNAAGPLPRRQLSDPTGNPCWLFAPNDYWLCQHPYHLLHCYCISGFSFPCVCITDRYCMTLTWFKECNIGWLKTSCANNFHFNHFDIQIFIIHKSIQCLKYHAINKESIYIKYLISLF